MKSILAWIFFPCVALALYCGTQLENEVKQHPGAEELKLSILNLERATPDMSPQLREYLKARSYTLLAQGIRSEWVDRQVDYGPIDREVLGSVNVVKGPGSDLDLYCLAMEAAGIKPSKQEEAAPPTAK